MQATLYNSMFKLPHLFNLYFSAISITYLLTDHRELFFGQKGAFFFYHSTHKVLIMAHQEGNCSGNTHKKNCFFPCTVSWSKREIPQGEQERFELPFLNTNLHFRVHP